MAFQGRSAPLGVGPLVFGEVQSRLDGVENGLSVSAVSEPFVDPADSLECRWRLRCVQGDFGKCFVPADPSPGDISALGTNFPPFRNFP